jgi:spermidine synthase
MRPPLALLLFLSGAAALSYEVLWARDWALLYGSTAVGTAVVLAAYFAGLALGAALGGPRAARARGLGLYAALEAGAAASVLAYLALRPALPEAAVWLARTLPAPLVPGAQALLAFAVLLVPTALVGATLPAATAALAPGDAPGAGRLYAWNTLGGAAGALACGLVAVRTLGTSGTFLAAAALGAATAATAALFRGRPPRPAPPAAATAPARTPRPRLAVGLAAITGFAGLASEVLWTRGLAGVLSNSVYSIALVLAAVLLGLVAGARLGAALLARPGPVEPRLATVYGLLALATAVSIAALAAVPDAAAALARALRVSGPGAGLAVEAVLAVGIVLPPVVALGAAFPLLLGLAAGDTPRATGRVLAANTTGGIAGALAAAFVLLPRLGLAGGLLVIAATTAAAAAAAATRRGGRALAIAAAAGLLLAAPLAPPVRLPWRGTGTDDALLFYRDGAAATVMVTADGAGGKRLRVNGQYSLGGTDGLFLERREAHLPLLLHPAPERVLALGVGTADTVGAALRHPGVRVDGVELIPEVLEAATLFAPENEGAVADPRARLAVGDARSFLLSTPERWDVIIADLFLPWTAGTASLYSLDFYRLGLAHLRPGGLYCQWLPLHQLGTQDLRAIVATFAAAFPHVELWLAYHRARTPLAALIGSAEPLRTDADALAARLADPALAPALATVGIESATDLGALYVAGGDRLRTATAGAPLVTDDRPGIEFTAPAAYFHQHGLGRAALAWVGARLEPTPPAAFPEASFALRAALLEAQLALLAGDGPGELRAYVAALDEAPGARVARRALGAIARERRAAGDPGTADAIAARLAAVSRVRLPAGTGSAP